MPGHCRYECICALPDTALVCEHVGVELSVSLSMLQENDHLCSKCESFSGVLPFKSKYFSMSPLRIVPLVTESI